MIVTADIERWKSNEEKKLDIYSLHGGWVTIMIDDSHIQLLTVVP